MSGFFDTGVTGSMASPRSRIGSKTAGSTLGLSGSRPRRCRDFYAANVRRGSLELRLDSFLFFPVQLSFSLGPMLVARLPGSSRKFSLAAPQLFISKRFASSKDAEAARASPEFFLKKTSGCQDGCPTVPSNSFSSERSFHHDLEHLVRAMVLCAIGHEFEPRKEYADSFFLPSGNPPRREASM